MTPRRTPVTLPALTPAEARAERQKQQAHEQLCRDVYDTLRSNEHKDFPGGARVDAWDRCTRLYGLHRADPALWAEYLAEYERLTGQGESDDPLAFFTGLRNLLEWTWYAAVLAFCAWVLWTV